VKSPPHASPALAADRVYIPTTDGRIVALRVENGEPVWERRLGGAVNDILALEHRLYAGRRTTSSTASWLATGASTGGGGPVRT
jgi:outer membrane protein assembly factor BamB